MRDEIGDVEYLRMVESCKDGYPHFHLLMRCRFVGRRAVAARWETLTGAYVVDLRRAHGKSGAYVAKYVSKSMGSETDWGRQRISVSRGFWKEEEPGDEVIAIERLVEHPSAYARRRANEVSFVRRSASVWTMEDREPGDDLPPELDTYQQVTGECYEDDESKIDC